MIEKVCFYFAVGLIVFGSINCIRCNLPSHAITQLRDRLVTAILKGSRQ